MRHGGIFVICLGAISVAAVATAVDYGALEPYLERAWPLPDDGSVWLSWDNGTPSSTNVTLSGWVAHNFDVSTLENYNYVRKFRMYMRAWPNRRWDGGRVGIYSFQGGVPGSLLWGPTFVMPTQEGWNDFEADCFLGNRPKFLAGWDQFYNYPDGDTLCFDTGPARTAKWIYSGGTWGPLASPNANMMLRVQVDDEH
ncbi:MAG TPA: hypothetical protein VMW93_08150, partial [bacterium]|nr:hypothetical protein [bacterium]